MCASYIEQANYYYDEGGDDDDDDVDNNDDDYDDYYYSHICSKLLGKNADGEIIKVSFF